MLLLLGFAFLAGAGTALSPCVLPVLPAVLSASGAGGTLSVVDEAFCASWSLTGMTGKIIRMTLVLSSS